MTVARVTARGRVGLHEASSMERGTQMLNREVRRNVSRLAAASDGADVRIRRALRHEVRRLAAIERAELRERMNGRG